MAALPVPPLALIADRFTKEERADRAVTAVRAGLRWVHLRDHRATPERFESAARDLVPRLRRTADDVTVSVNTHHAVAETLGTGLHLGGRGPSVREARKRLGDDVIIGYSAHEKRDIHERRTSDVDYYFFSPVYPTTSKPDQPPAGRPALRSFCRTADPIPTVALGGITPERVQPCFDAGARGVAVLSGIMKSKVPGAATRAYLRAVEEAGKTV